MKNRKIIKELEIVKLKPDDLVIVKVNAICTNDEIKHIKNSIQRVIPEGVNLLFLVKDNIEFDVYRKVNKQHYRLREKWYKMNF